MYIDSSVKKYLDDLSAKKTTPGGGSAGALAGAVAAGLVSMVANFSIGKNLPDEKKIKEILQTSGQLKEKMSKLVDEDILVYEELSSVFKLPKKDKRREEELQKALKKAAEIPLQILEAAAATMWLNKDLFPICNKNLISDVGVSISLAYSSAEIGALNVEINLASIKDKNFNNDCREKLENFLNTCRKIRKQIYPQVEEKIS